MLVLAVAQRAAGLGLAAATVAALVFALLPMQTESVAWITGRVDSMPACFFLASFLLFVRWRSEQRRRDYAWSVAWCAVALLSKQNTVVLAPVLMAFDLVVRRAPVRIAWAWLRPYVPFIVLTAAYLALRYELFGEIARESMLNARQLGVFQADLAAHLKRLVYGEPGVAMPGARAGGVGRRPGGGQRRVRRPDPRAPRPAAGRGGDLLRRHLDRRRRRRRRWSPATPRRATCTSPRSAGRSCSACRWNWRGGARPAPRGPSRWRPRSRCWRSTPSSCGREVARWESRADTSYRVVRDLEAEAQRLPAGALVVAGAPRRSFDFAVPHALRPPFTGRDVTAQLRVVTHSSIHCCPAHLWEPHTRGLLRAWLDDPARPPVAILHWDETSGAAPAGGRRRPALHPRAGADPGRDPRRRLARRGASSTSSRS